MEIFFIQTFIGYIIDLLVGDPPRLSHPVVLIGKGIDLLGKMALKAFCSPAGLKVAGIGITILIVMGCFFITSLVLKGLMQINYYLYLFGGAWIVSTTIATRGLAGAAEQIRQLLVKHDLTKARQQVGWIVGRDTKNMENGEVVRATIETVAENLNDAVIAPLFYACIGGPALAMAYRAINTLDSMIGYKNDKYLYLGWASAKLDDAAGYIPARLTGLVLLFTAWLSNRDWRRALKSWRRDAALHPSPNGGIPESVMAGSLGVRLGGKNVYGEVISYRPFLGDQVELLRSDHINSAVDMLYQTSMFSVICIPLLVLIFKLIVVQMFLF